jgi:AraC-like DNA-binding protein
VALSRVVRLADPSAFQAAIPFADLTLFPTAKGTFHAEITQIGMKRLWMQRFHVSLPQVNTLAVKRGRRSIGFLTQLDSSPFLHCGLEVSPGDIVVNRFDVVHQRSDANLHYGTMSLSMDDLDTAAETIIGRELPRTPYKRVVRPDPVLMLRLLKLHRSVGQLAHDAPDVLELSQVHRALENELIHVMVRSLDEGDATESNAGSRRHDNIIARFEEFLEANSDRPLYLAEICAAIGVAERTLRASCEEHLGMGPIRYLTLRRMHLARRALLRSDPSRATVTEIVTDHGFWELGRFSVAYRMLFGESPSRTLRRPMQQLEVCLNRPSSLAAANLRVARTQGLA